MELELIPWQRDRSRLQRAEMYAAMEEQGFEVFLWSDPPGTRYQLHQHEEDECLWLLAGEMTFAVGENDYQMFPGDRLLLPARTLHRAKAGAQGATYLVGHQRR